MKNTNEKKEKNWIIRSYPEEKANSNIRAIAEYLGIEGIIAELLYNRGYKDPRAAKSFVYMETEML